jgi:hypothetical protein
MHWLSWDKLTASKCQVGMGFKDLECFNIALLGKQAWRLVMNPNSLCARVLQSRYYRDRSFIEATAPRGASETWRAILAGREALRLGLVKITGLGETVSIWDISWIPFPDSKKPMGKKYDASQTIVNELITVDNNGTYR